MPKTLSPGVVDLPHGSFRANVQPDVFDERDLVYRPRLTPLPPTQDGRPGDRYVLTQQGNSCTGHAVAAMINAVLAAGSDGTHVSPYMLYRLARRYDEFQGEADEGSSLRGALKGWYYHGILPDSEWPGLDTAPEPDFDQDPRLRDLALQRPMGAFYRVNTARLDDLQSAVTELSAVAASAAIHEGWARPTPVERGEERMWVIERPPGARQLGGHAFCIVGYNETGFLVQNSWGREWGRSGFATLPYDDWLDTAYDAWVARPGVRSVVRVREHARTVTVTGGAIADGPGPDLHRLTRHVVNLGNDGRLSTGGRFVSSPAQIDRVVEHMARYHELWADRPADGDDGTVRRVLLYAHGGLTSEGEGLALAQRQLNWWLNNRVYPITFAWQSGPVETLVDQLTDAMEGRTPAGGIGIDLVEQFDRLVERFARTNARWMWDEMKENAARASAPIPAAAWPSAGPVAERAMAELPGASLTVARLADYIRSCPPGARVQVDLVGHSAGSIFLAGVLDRLVEADISVHGLTYLAAALRTDTWVRQVLPHLRAGRVGRFASFGLSADRELDDVVGLSGRNVYQKSLLYLVARALERHPTATEVPLVGMIHFAATPVEGTSVNGAVADIGGELVWAPSAAPARSRSDSRSHGGFDDDSPTLTSVMLRVLDRDTADRTTTFRAHAPLTGPEPPEPAGTAAAAPEQLATVDAEQAGTAPVAHTAAPRAGASPAPVPRSGDDSPEVRVAPASSSTILDLLSREGWRPVSR
ncbi:C1 family peptidase [Geodermatophilus sp. URMC 64]